MVCRAAERIPEQLGTGKLGQSFVCRELEPFTAADGKRAWTDSGADVTTYLFFIIPYLYTARLVRIWKQLDIFVF